MQHPCENESPSFDAIDRISPAYMIGREAGDIMNIAVANIETLEYFFAHTIGPVLSHFTAVTTVVLAWFVNPLYAGADPNLYYDQRVPLGRHCRRTEASGATGED